VRTRRTRCTQCGFLGWDVTGPDETTPIGWWELHDYWRNRLSGEPEKGYSVEPDTEYSFTVGCRRGQWRFSTFVKGTDSRMRLVNAETLALDKPRQCPYYMRYEPGFGPDEHKELKRDQDTQKVVWRAALLGALIGASVAIAAQILYIAYGPQPSIMP